MSSRKSTPSFRPPPPALPKPLKSRPYAPIHNHINVPKPHTKTPSLTNTMMDGLAFGAGSAIAHNTINSLPIFSSSTKESTERRDRLNRCTFWLDMYTECIRSEGAKCGDIVEQIEKECKQSNTIIT